MKQLLLLYTLFLTFYGYTQKTEEQWFEELTDLYYEGDAMTAYLGFGRFVEKHPKSDLVSRAKLNQGFLLRALGKDGEAKLIFESILRSKYDEYEAYGGIMEQFTLYKHRSAKQLAEIALLEKDYNNAGKYIEIFHTVYPYKHFCGNELSANEIYTDAMYAKMYHGKGKTKRAVQKLLPHMFFNGLAGNHEIIELLEEYLPIAFSKEQLSFFLKQSIESFKTRKNGKKAYFTLLDVKISLDAYQLSYMNGIEVNVEVDETLNQEALRTLFKKHPVWSSYME
ncbi:MAG: hypothetical protein AAGL34_13415 [Bacteroidota bacterium]